MARRLVNHARPQTVTGGYTADWTVEQLRGSTQMKCLVAELREQQTEGTRLDRAIGKNLETLGFWEREG